MIFLILSFWIGCRAVNHPALAVPMGRTMTVIHTDTTKISPPKVDKLQEPKIVVPTSQPQFYNNLDSLRKQNYALVNANLYILNRAKLTREQRDSLSTLIKAVQDTLNHAVHNATEFYALQRKSIELGDQVKVFNKSGDFQVYGLFIIILILQLLSIWMSNKIRKRQYLNHLT